ncbi:unnamed protein product [Cyprideis torosa]|uniref:Uncharacterized protein n=1 Tax=Cyprideis torosa TaxID=163714 RepID=A0A7R8W599_9CRUS|nr:unnamed protein product [Cyprideis torosa]CAG0885036.1 unnamed protein product [Cyprideis torosa]
MSLHDGIKDKEDGCKAITKIKEENLNMDPIVELEDISSRLEQSPSRVALNRRGVPARIRKKNRLIFGDDEMIEESNSPATPSKKSSGFKKTLASPRRATASSVTSRNVIRMINPNFFKITPNKKRQQQEDRDRQSAQNSSASTFRSQARRSLVKRHPVKRPKLTPAQREVKTRTDQLYFQLRNFVKLPNAHRWAYFEWFYSHIDRPLLYCENDFERCLRECFPQLQTRMLSRAEWRIIRRLLGKPRRCSDFDRSDLGNKTVPDYEVMVDQPLEWIPLSVYIARIRPRLNFPLLNSPSALVTALPFVTSSGLEMLSHSGDPLLSHARGGGIVEHTHLLQETIGLFSTKFLLNIIRLEKILRTKRRQVHQLAKYNAEAEHRRSQLGLSGGAEVNALQKELPFSFQSKYANLVLELEKVNMDLNQYLTEVQSFCKEMAPSYTPNSHFNQLKSFSFNEARGMVQAYSSLRRAPSSSVPKEGANKRDESGGEGAETSGVNSGGLVTGEKNQNLIIGLVSLMLQVKSLAYSDSNSYEVRCLSDTCQEIKSQIDPKNTEQFENEVEIRIRHIQSGLTNLRVKYEHPPTTTPPLPLVELVAICKDQEEEIDLSWKTLADPEIDRFTLQVTEDAYKDSNLYYRPSWFARIVPWSIPLGKKLQPTTFETVNAGNCTFNKSVTTFTYRPMLHPTQSSTTVHYHFRLTAAFVDQSEDAADEKSCSLHYHVDEPLLSTLAIIGIACGAVVAVAVLAAVVVIRNKKEHARKLPLARQVSSSSLKKSTGSQKRQQRSTRILEKNLLEECKRILADEAKYAHEELERIKDASPLLEDIGNMPDAWRDRNRFSNIRPFSKNRVILHPFSMKDEQTPVDWNDYINASYIPGEHDDCEYIATQGPKASTATDFWYMIWQEKPSVIVMLSRLVEGGKRSDLDPGVKEPTHYVTLLIFLTWPDFGTPATPIPLLRFLQIVRSCVPITAKPAPLVVHCSAGVGRTGTFIALDRLCYQLQKKRAVDVYKTVLELRQSRVHMVKTKEQYAFLYRCLAFMAEDPGSRVVGGMSVVLDSCEF